MDDIMTVKEYAGIKGCTDRAVYRRIERGSLDSYLVIRDGKKMLLRQLLTDEGLTEQVQELNIFSPEHEHEQYKTLYYILEEMKRTNEILENIEKKIGCVSVENTCNTGEKEQTALSEQVIESKKNTGLKRFFGLFGNR